MASPTPEHEIREIDLMDLFAILWEGRWIISGLTIVAALAGFVAIKAMPSVFRVEAVLAGPTQYDLQALQPSVLQRGAASADALRDYQVAPLAPKTVYITALAEVNSLTLKRQYWEAEGRALVGEEFGSSGDGEALRAFARSLELSTPTTIAGVDTQARLSFLTEDPAAGVEVLSRYLAFAQQQIIGRQIQQLRLGLQTSLARLEQDYAASVAYEKLRQEDELTRLREAYSVAAALEIVELPYDKFENVWLKLLDNRDYLLGTAVLGKEIAALEARGEKPLEAFVPYLRDMDRWRQQISRDIQRLDSVEARGVFDVIAPPEMPLRPVKPNKPLLLIAVVFAAFIVSVFGVLFRHGWKSYHARTAEAE